MPATFHPAAEKVPGRYIVLLKDGTNKTTHITSVKESTEGNSGGSSISADFITHGNWTPDVINGYACKLSDEGVKELLENPDVDIIAEDSIMSIYDDDTRNNVPWGLQRISETGPIPSELQKPDELKFTYNLARQITTSGPVDVYVVDTGIYTDHSDFCGRARWGYSSNSNAGIETDDHGHGTHVAGTIAGARYGVAPNAHVNLIGVKVFPKSGKGPTSEIIDGLAWIGRQFDATPPENRRPTVVNMSLGGPANPLTDRAVIGLIEKNIHVAVAAGNDGRDASKYSPARVQRAITVGASDITDHMWDERPKGEPYASNYGTSVDIVAPGADIVSCGIAGPNSTDIMSGTSMATPHVAGVVAYSILCDGNEKPDELKAKITNLATNGALTISDKFPGTPNLLAYNNSGA